MPKLISSEVYPFACFLTLDNAVVVYHFVRDDFIFILFIIHGCESVDYVSTLNTEYHQTGKNSRFFLWSIKSKSLTSYYWDSNGCCTVTKWPWTNPTQSYCYAPGYICGKCRELSFVPAVEDDCDNSTENLRYVFALKVY